MPNSNPISVVGTCSLHELRNAIRYEEANFWKFKDLRVGDGQNIVTFEEWDGLPSEIKIILAADSPPNGMQEQWRGTVRCQNIDVEAVLYRA